ncbi:hypothetical protein [Rubritalea tangerina]
MSLPSEMALARSVEVIVFLEERGAHPPPDFTLLTCCISLGTAG